MQDQTVLSSWSLWSYGGHMSGMRGEAATPIRVFLLDDHEIVRRGIRELLRGDDTIEVVGESGLAEEGAARILALRPDVAVLDIALPDGSGIEVCRRVRSRDPAIAVLMLTSYEDDEALFAAIAAGAAGYLLKKIRGNDLAPTIRRLAAGQSALDPAITQRVLERIRRGSDQDTRHELTPQEARVLELVGEGLTNRQIAEHTHLAENTVKNYVSAVLAKLEVGSRTQAAVMASRVGRIRT